MGFRGFRMQVVVSKPENARQKIMKEIFNPLLPEEESKKEGAGYKDEPFQASPVVSYQAKPHNNTLIMKSPVQQFSAKLTAHKIQSLSQNLILNM